MVWLPSHELPLTSRSFPGVWTRFFPLAYKFQELAFNGAIGDIRQVFADFGMAFYGALPDSHRVFNAELAGGAQLDLGPYTMLWVSPNQIFGLRTDD